MIMQKQRLFNLLMVLILCLSSFGSLSAAPVMASQNKIPNQNYVIANVYFNDKAQLDDLAARLDIWKVEQAQGYVVAMLTEQQLQKLIEAGIRAEVDLVKTEQIHQPLVPLLGQGPDSIPGYPCYRTVEETFATLDTLASTYPDLVELYDIGDSWNKVQNPANGYDIIAMRITNEAMPGPKPVFFLMAEIHARELVTAEAATRFIEYLLSGYATNADIHWLLDYYEIHVVPMNNPDGRKFAETGEWWRKNTDSDDGCSDPNNWGTDLNRNFGFHWNQGGSDDYPCGETYHGPSADSEPETLAIENYIVTLFEDQRGGGDTDPAPITTTGSLITLHSAAGLVLWPWGWTGTDAPNHAELRTLGRKMAYFNNYTPQQSNDLYLTTGTTDDWSYGELGIASYTFEMGDYFFQDCDTFQNTIYPTNRNAILYAFKATRQPYMDPKGPESLYLSALPDNIHPGQNVNLGATANDERYGGGGEPTQNIAAARFSIDKPSWIEGAVTYPMSATDGSFNSKTEAIQGTIDTSGLHAGRHIIFVESQDADGNWGVPSAIFLTIASELTPDSAADEGLPGEVITYTMEYTNGLAVAKEFKVTVTSDWAVSAPSTLGTLGSLESASFDVAVSIPISATAGDNDSAIVKVTQVGNVNIYDTSQLVTTANANGVVITPTNVTQTGAPGSDVVYEMEVTNLGVLTDSFNLDLSSNWVASLSENTTGPLAPGASESVVLTVSVPLEAVPGDMDTALITATSQSDPGIFAVATRTTVAQAEYGLAVSVQDDSLRTTAAGTPVTYTVFLSNTGSFTDTINLTISSTWQVNFNTPIGPLGPGEGATVEVVVNVPAEAVWGDMDVARLTFTSQGNPEVFQDINLTTLLVWYNLLLPITVK
jgi:carboxypeptidase T